jgi:hypothetical protein
MEVIGVLVGVLGTFISVAVSVAIYRRQADTAEAKAYRSPIAEARAEVAKGKDSFAVLSRHKGAIESAATVYRPTLRTKRAVQLDVAMVQFRNVCTTVQPGVSRHWQSMATGEPTPDPTPQVVAALDELLAVAA